MTTARLRTGAAALIAALAAFWFYLSSASVSSTVESGTLSTPAIVAIGLASAVNLVALVLAAVAAYYLPHLLNRGKSTYFWFVLTVLAANCVTAVADQFGVIDAIYLIASLVAIGLVITLRRSLLTRPRGEPAR